jgi:hypothetical protein
MCEFFSRLSIESVDGKPHLCECFKMLTGKPTGKRPLGRPRHRWEDNIRMDFKEIRINMRNWVGLAQDRDRWRALVNVAMNLWVP